MSATKKISLHIDGQLCETDDGRTILEVARANKIAIPTLCYFEGLTPWGGCRLCIVEIEGSPKIVPACTTPATAGIKVITKSERLHNLRRATLELLFSERNHICPMCQYNKGDCGLQHQGYLHGIDSIRYPYLYPTLPVDVSARYFGMDHNRCILCTRCVRTCDEFEGAHTLDVAYRGIRNRMIVDMNQTLAESLTCTSCGACVANCPTGALFDKAAAFRGPLASCQQVLTTCTECPVGCGLKVFTKENRIVNVWGDPGSPVNRGHLCVKGRYQTWAEPRERILTPLVRKNGALQKATWTEALDTIRKAAKAAKTTEKALLVLPRLTNETAKTITGLAGKIDRVGMHVATNEAALCAQPEYTADALTKLQDADAIIIIGAQPARDNGVLAARIRTTVRKRGAKLLIFHARKTNLDQFADVRANVVSLEHQSLETGGGDAGRRQAPRHGVRAECHDAHRRHGDGTIDQDSGNQPGRAGAVAHRPSGRQQQPRARRRRPRSRRGSRPVAGRQTAEVPAHRGRRRPGWRPAGHGRNRSPRRAAQD